MKAIQIHQYGSEAVLQLNDIGTPTPTLGQVLVKVHYAALNPKDVMVRKGKLRLFTGNKFPLQLGYEFAGIIEEGNDSYFKKGDAVYGMINSWKAGAYAEYLSVPAQELALMPNQLSFAEAAAIPLAALTSLQALRNIGGIKKGDTVCINGASGGVGTFAIQIAKRLGANVIAVSSQKNHAICQALGADDVVDYRSTTLSEAIEARSVNIFFDVFGNQSFKAIHPLLKPKGIAITTIPNMVNVLHTLRSRFFPFGKRMKLVVVKSNQKDLELLSQWVSEGTLRVVIDQEFSIAQVAEAHRAIETKRTVGKIVLNVAI